MGACIRDRQLATISTSLEPYFSIQFFGSTSTSSISVNGAMHFNTVLLKGS